MAKKRGYIPKKVGKWIKKGKSAKKMTDGFTGKVDEIFECGRTTEKNGKKSAHKLAKYYFKN